MASLAVSFRSCSMHQGFLRKLWSLVPEAFVLNRDGRLAYRGAINNAYQSIGRRRAVVEHHYLRDAILATSKGEVVRVVEDPACWMQFSQACVSVGIKCSLLQSRHSGGPRRVARTVIGMNKLLHFR